MKKTFFQLARNFRSQHLLRVFLGTSFVVTAYPYSNELIREIRISDVHASRVSLQSLKIIEIYDFDP